MANKCSCRYNAEMFISPQQPLKEASDVWAAPCSHHNEMDTVVEVLNCILAQDGAVEAELLHESRQRDWMDKFWSNDFTILATKMKK